MPITSIINSWNKYLSYEFEKPYFLDLISFLQKEQIKSNILPSDSDIFNAFNLTTLENTKVVILGQDPYHREGQAHGLAFSVKEHVSFPPSLRNIFKEYCSDLGYTMPSSGDLSKWAKDGVLLLNAVLTVKASLANSHRDKGWEIFTDEVIRIISEKKEHVVFILWGKPAQLKAKLVDKNKHLILMASHPSPLSSYRGFFGSKPFTKANTFLKVHHIKEIDWKLE